MAIRHLNYTKRHDFNEGDIEVRLVDPAQRPPAVRMSLNLADAQLPPDARIYFEAYRRTMRMRFEYGTVGNPGFPAGVAVLTDFPDADGLLFGVKITSVHETDAGKLLADRDRIRLTTSSESDRRQTLLPTLSGDVGHQVWQLDFQATGPELVFSERLSDWKTFAADPLVKSLIYPSILRTVLTKAVIIDEWPDDDDTTWQGQWLQFAGGFVDWDELGPDSPMEDRVRWIDDVVAAFSCKAGLVALSGAARTGDA